MLRLTNSLSKGFQDMPPHIAGPFRGLRPQEMPDSENTLERTRAVVDRLTWTLCHGRCERRSFNDSSLFESRTGSQAELSEVGLVSAGLGRRTFVEALAGLPFGGVALSAETS